MVKAERSAVHMGAIELEGCCHLTLIQRRRRLNEKSHLILQMDWIEISVVALVAQRLKQIGKRIPSGSGDGLHLCPIAFCNRHFEQL